VNTLRVSKNSLLQQPSSAVDRSALLRLRARLIQAARCFFLEDGFLEVETPVLIPGPAPETHIDAVPADGGFLQTSPELCMKRLLADGFDRIFQICKCFRRGERGRLHLPEFTMLEWYRLDADYRRLMTDCEELVGAVAEAFDSGPVLRYEGWSIDLTPPWERLTVAEAFTRHSPVPLEEALAADRFDEILVCHIEPRLGVARPVFLCDYPAALGSLSRLKPADPRWAERVELYIGGLELANGFSELTDAGEQCRRFREEASVRLRAGKDAYPAPERFLRDLEKLAGREAAGIALGIDRLVMLFTGRICVDDIVAFTPEDL